MTAILLSDLYCSQYYWEQYCCRHSNKTKGLCTWIPLAWFTYWVSIWIKPVKFNCNIQAADSCTITMRMYVTCIIRNLNKCALYFVVDCSRVIQAPILYFPRTKFRARTLELWPWVSCAGNIKLASVLLCINVFTHSSFLRGNRNHPRNYR